VLDGLELLLELEPEMTSELIWVTSVGACASGAGAGACGARESLLNLSERLNTARSWAKSLLNLSWRLNRARSWALIWTRAWIYGRFELARSSSWLSIRAWSRSKFRTMT
jgi:hypothetical protein